MHAVSRSRSRCIASIRASSSPRHTCDSRAQSAFVGVRPSGSVAERVADLLQAEPHPLRGPDERQPPQHRSRVFPLVAGGALGRDQPPLLVEPQRGVRHATAPRDLANRQVVGQFRHGTRPLPEPRPRSRYLALTSTALEVASLVAMTTTTLDLAGAVPAHDRRRETRVGRRVHIGRPVGALRPRARRLARHRRRPRPRPVPALQGPRPDGVLRRPRRKGFPRPGHPRRLDHVRLAARPAPGPQPGARRRDRQRLARPRARRSPSAPRSACVPRTGTSQGFSCWSATASWTRAATTRPSRSRAGCGLDRLTAIAIDNGSASHGWPGGIASRFTVEGWHATTVDGRDHDALYTALTARHDGPNAVVATIRKRHDHARDLCGHRVTATLDADPRLAVVTADISAAAFAPARARHPHRVLNVGIREQAMIGVAGGLALTGMRPVVHSYTPFLVERPFEQIKLDLGHQDVGAVLVSIGGSYDDPVWGRTHQGPGDVALLDTLPGWTVHVPGHPDEVAPLLRDALAGDGRVYLRLSSRENRGAHPATGRFSVVRKGTRRHGRRRRADARQRPRRHGRPGRHRAVRARPSARSTTVGCGPPATPTSCSSSRTWPARPRTRSRRVRRRRPPAARARRPPRRRGPCVRHRGGARRRPRPRPGRASRPRSANSSDESRSGRWSRPGMGSWRTVVG